MQLTNLLTTLLIAACTVQAAVPLGNAGQIGDITLDPKLTLDELETRAGQLETRKMKSCISGACNCQYDDGTRCARTGTKCDCDWWKGTAQRTARDCIALGTALGRTKC